MDTGSHSDGKLNEARPRRWFQIGAIAALLWVFAVTAAYYVGHKPFTAPNVVAVGQTLAGLGGMVLLVVLGTGVGVVLLRLLDVAPAERLIWAAALGLGVVSVAALGLGAVGLLRTWLLWWLTVMLLLVVRRPLWRALRAAWGDLSCWPGGRFETLLAAYCGLTLLLALIWALTPPTAWDGLVYHLTGPKLYLATGQVSHPLDLPYLGFPQLVEMLFTWGMGLGGERAAAAIHWFYGLLVVLALVTAGRRWMGGAAGWLAAAVLLSALSVVLLAGWPYADLALLAYATLAFLALIRFREGGSRARRWLVLSGMFTGLALSTKYTALALLPALGLALLFADGKSHNADRKSQVAIRHSLLAIRDSLLLCAIALAVWSPWLVKNLLLTGNPVYPFFFGGVYWDHWRSWWYDRPGTGLAYTAPWKLLTVPWDATIWGVEGAAGYSATTGPLYLAFLPLLFLAWRRLPVAQRRWLRMALGFCGVFYGFWLWGVARTELLIQMRLLFPVFGLLAMMASAAIEGLRVLPRRPFDLSWLARTVLVLVLVLTLVRSGLDLLAGNPLGIVVGLEEREDWLIRRLGWYYAAVEAINQQLPPDSVVLFLWEPRSYHCAVDCRPDALLDRFLHATHVYGPDATTIAAAWRAEGVTHVLFYRQGYEAVREAGFDPLTGADVAALEALERYYLQEVRDLGGAYTLYRLKESPGGEAD